MLIIALIAIAACLVVASFQIHSALVAEEPMSHWTLRGD
jgi:hypothetical protein